MSQDFRAKFLVVGVIATLGLASAAAAFVYVWTDPGISKQPQKQQAKSSARPKASTGQTSKISPKAEPPSWRDAHALDGLRRAQWEKEKQITHDNRDDAVLHLGTYLQQMEVSEAVKRKIIAFLREIEMDDNEHFTLRRRARESIRKAPAELR